MVRLQRVPSSAPFAPAIVLAGTLQLSSGCTNARETPGLTSRVLACLGNGVLATVGGGPHYTDQKVWWHLRGEGWIVHDFLICASNTDDPVEVGGDRLRHAPSGPKAAPLR